MARWLSKVSQWQGCCINLKQRPDAIDKLALWLHTEWLKTRTDASMNPANAFSTRKKHLQKHIGHTQVPATFLALSQKSLSSAVIGCVSLTRIASRNRKFQQGLWVTNLFVVPTARAMGVGAALLRAAEVYAAEIGQSQLYLYTKSSQRYYQRLGWRTVIDTTAGESERAGRPSGRIIMHKALSF